MNRILFYGILTKCYPPVSSNVASWEIHRNMPHIYIYLYKYCCGYGGFGGKIIALNDYIHGGFYYQRV